MDNHGLSPASIAPAAWRKRDRWFRWRFLLGAVFIGGVILAGVLLGSASGVLGRAVAGGSLDGMRIEYDPIVRKHVPSTLLLQIDRRPPNDTRLRLVLSGDYSRVAQIHGTTLPVLGLTPNGALLGADIGDGDAPLIVAIHVVFLRAGLVHGQIYAPGGRSIALTQFVYP